MAETTKSLYTSEFYLTILTNVAVIAAMMTGKISAEVALGFLAGGNGLYTIGRGIAKNNVKPD